MTNCPNPECGEKHRVKPTQCFLDAMDLHKKICQSATKHAAECFLPGMIDFIAQKNSTVWAEWTNSY